MFRTETPWTVSFATTVTPASAATNSHLPSMASNNLFSALSYDDEAANIFKPPVLSHHASPANTGTSTDQSTILSPFTNLDEDSPTHILDTSTSSISTPSVNIITSNHQLKKRKKVRKKFKKSYQNKTSKHAHASIHNLKHINNNKKFMIILYFLLTATLSPHLLLTLSPLKPTTL